MALRDRKEVMNHFFTDPALIQGMDIYIQGEDVKHIKNVLRMKPGEEISVSNGIDDKEYRCEIAEINDSEVRCRLRFIKEDGVELPLKITLFQGLPKADKMELIIQKAVELGAASIIPVACKRCMVQLDDKKYAKKQERWQEIALAAAKQSKRALIPEVGEQLSFKQAVEVAKDMECRCIPYELAEGMEATRSFLDKVAKAPAGSRAAIFIGPEGGFAEEEIELAKSAGIEPISLGRRILRTETAGMALLSMIMLETERSAGT